MCSSIVSLRALPLLVAALSAATSLTLGCGPGILSPKTPPPPLFFVDVEAQNALAIEGDVRGALAWSVYSDELVTCMDGVEVNGLIELTSDDPFDPAYQLVQQIQSCVLFSDRGHVETASVAVEAEFPASFTIPVTALPDGSVLTGSDGARLGIADVLVYVDDDGDALYSETPLGADAFVDRVVGTSRAFREEDVDESFIVYREGELSSVWKVYRGLYGCADPPQGVSTVTLRVNEFAAADEPYFECVIDASPVPVELHDGGALDGLACAADPDQHTYQRPGDDGLPAGAVGECVAAGDGWFDVVFTTDVDSVCPDVGRYDLVGCSDLTSEAACRATSWDLVLNQPSWWPCKFSGGDDVFIGVIDDEASSSEDVDALFTLTWGDGFGAYALDSIEVSAIVDDAGSEVALALGNLVDNDNNVAFNAGDELVVREPADAPDTFTAGSVPGNYPIVLRVNGVVVEASGYRAFQPVPIPTLLGVEASGVDAPAPITFGADEVAIVTMTTLGSSANPTSYALDDVDVHCYLGGEYPLLFSLRDEEFIAGTLALTSDVDGDGRFGNGDALTLRERENTSFVLDPDGVAAFSATMYCSLSLDVGFQAYVHAASFTLELDAPASE